MGLFCIDASYRYSADVHEGNVDQFKLEITVSSIYLLYYQKSAGFSLLPGLQHGF